MKNNDDDRNNIYDYDNSNNEMKHNDCSNDNTYREKNNCHHSSFDIIMFYCVTDIKNFSLTKSRFHHSGDEMAIHDYLQ